MKTLINIHTARKLGGDNVTQIIMDDMVAIETISNLILNAKIDSISPNTYRDLSGINHSGYIVTSMLASRGGLVVHKETTV